MQDVINQEMSFYIDEIEKSVNELYDDEINFNNADKTSGQRVYSKEEIRQRYIKTLLKRLMDQVL